MAVTRKAEGRRCILGRDRVALMSYWKSLGLTTRSANALCNIDIRNVDELRWFGAYDFSRLPMVGKKSVENIRDTVGWL